MKKNFWWLIVVIVFVAGLLVSNLLVQAKENVNKIQWLYKTERVNLEEEPSIAMSLKTREKKIKRQLNQDLKMLNGQGRDGWELCGVFNLTNYLVYYFKKEREIEK